MQDIVADKALSKTTCTNFVLELLLLELKWLAARDLTHLLTPVIDSRSDSRPTVHRHLTDRRPSELRCGDRMTAPVSVWIS